MNGPHLERLRAVAAPSDARLFAVGGHRDLRHAPEGMAEGVPASVHVFTVGRSVEHSWSASIGPTSAEALAFSGERLLVGTADGRVLAFEAGEAKGEWRGEAAITALVAVDGAIVATDRSGTVHHLNGALKPQASRSLFDGSIGALAIHEGVVIMGCSDGVVRAVALADLGSADVRDMPLAAEAVTAVAVTDDRRVVAGLADGHLMLCFLEGAIDAEQRSQGAPHDAAVRGLALVPARTDDKGRELPSRMLSLSEDGALKSWEVDSRRRPKTVGTMARAQGLALVAPSPSADDATKGGHAVVVSEARRLAVLHIDREGQTEGWREVDSHFAQLKSDLNARADTARKGAISELATLPEDDARLLLQAALASDRQASLRALAASVLGETQRRLARPALRTALDDGDGKVREAALAALRQIEESTPLAPITAALGSRHWDVRMEAILLLPSLRDASPLVPGLVADGLTDAHEDVRAAALESLFELAERGSLEPYATAMRHGPEDVRIMALVRLAREAEIGDGGRDLLERALDDEADAVRRIAFLVAVARQRRLATWLASVDEVSRKELTRLAERARIPAPADPGADWTDADAQPLFASLAARSSDSALRGARALGALADPRASGALLSLSREAGGAFRRQVVEALERAAYAMPQDTRLTARLEWLLDDDDEHVRAAALDALRRLGEPEGAPGELSLAGLALRVKAPDIRLRALPLLTPFGGDGPHAGDGALAEGADSLLSDALDDENQRVRAEAFRTLRTWNAKDPRDALTRGARSRHPDIRTAAATELARVKEPYADELLIELARDTDASVGRAAYEKFTDKSKEHANDARIFAAVLGSPRPSVQVLGCQKLPASLKEELVSTVVALVRDDDLRVQIAAIEAVDRLEPEDVTAFAEAFASKHYALRVRAGELCGKRRDPRAIGPMEALLSIGQDDLRRPVAELRQRAAAALADVGSPETLEFLTALLEEDDGLVAEQGARGLATAARPGRERPLVDALAHEHLAVRSWVAEGLARLGDTRAIPVLAGALAHEHRPIRVGAIFGYVALGADGVRGILAGLDDADRTIADLCFAVVVARDLALRQADLPPDLLLSVLGSAQADLRFAAARLLEARTDPDALREIAVGLVGPPIPDRASAMEDWPDEDRRRALVNVVVDMLASDHPARRYAATQVLALRHQPKAFWREAARLQGPTPSRALRIPHTNWEAEERQPPRKGWVRALFDRTTRRPAEPGTGRVLEVVSFVGGTRGRAAPSQERTFAEHRRLAFGTYVGLVRQAPAPGEEDQTHRVRRDSLGRLAELASADDVGREVVLPVLRQSLNDPSHLVRRAAVASLRGLYPEGALEPLSLMLESTAADVGKAAVDALLEAAQAGDEDAAARVRKAVDASVSDVRKHALAVLPRLYDSGSAEPYIVALGSTHADVRVAVVDRLVDSTDDRVKQALTRAMESSHEDLRLKAAAALARRGDDKTVDVLGGLLRSERPNIAPKALEALVDLAHARPTSESNAEAAAKAAGAVAQRIQDDPDRTADRAGLIDALGRIGSPAAGPALLALAADEEPWVRERALNALVSIAVDREAGPQRLRDGRTRRRFQEALVLEWLGELFASPHEPVRLQVAQLLQDVDDPGAETLLAELLGDRREAVRTAACEALAFRLEHVPEARVDSLTATLRGGRREMVLPAAAGLAHRQRPEAFQALLLVLVAGLQEERARAVLALGDLGDPRAVDELRIFLDVGAELEPEDAALAPSVARAYGKLLRQLPEDAAVRDEVRTELERLATETVGPVRLAALTGLREAGDERSRALLERTAGDALEDHQLSRHAIEQLAILGDPASEEVLASLLRGSALRHEALRALERIFPDDRTRTSLHALTSDDASIQARGAAYLMRHGDPATLAESLSTIADPTVRETLRRGLIRRGACPVDALRGLLAGDAPGPRADAMWIAGASPVTAKALAADISKALERTLKDRGPGAERATIDHALRAGLWAATKLGADAASVAGALVGDRTVDAAVRQQALSFLASKGPGPAIRDAAFDPDREVRALAGEALAETDEGAALFDGGAADGAALEPVVSKLRKSDEQRLYRTARARQIALPVVLGTGPAPALFTLATGGGKTAQRFAAIQALGRFSGEAAAEAEAALTAMAKDDGEDEVRAAAFRSLRRLQRRRRRLEEGHAS